MTRMRRRTAALVVITLGLAACGSGDDDATGAADDVSTEESSEASTGEATAAGVTDENLDATTDDGEGGEDTATAEDPPTADDTDDGSDVTVETDEGDDGGGDGPTIRSIDDVPEQCRALMEDFLQEIEPIVEGVDWENATLADFEQIAADFEQFATDFDTRSAEEECDDLDFEDDDGMELIIEFASDVAPGTVGFFRFLEGMLSSMPGGDGETGDGGNAAGGDTIESCDDAIAFMEGLIAEYDALTDVPISEITTFTNLGSVMMDCTPEQLEFFDSPEVQDFLGG